jgi:hypothetical protein
MPKVVAVAQIAAIDVDRTASIGAMHVDTVTDAGGALRRRLVIEDGFAGRTVRDHDRRAVAQ